MGNLPRPPVDLESAEQNREYLRYDIIVQLIQHEPYADSARLLERAEKIVQYIVKGGGPNVEGSLT